MLAVVLVMAVSALPLAFSSTWLLPVLLVPVGALAWVLRARVEADPTQLRVCNGLGVRRVAWDDVRGFQVPPRGPVRLLTDDAPPLRLTAVTRRELPQLLEVSRTA
jgi:hypothetical protein